MSREDAKKSKKICCSGSWLPFCLGMMDYNCCDIPDPKREKLNLSKKKLEKPKPLSPSAWFNTTVSSEEIRREILEGMHSGRHN